MVVRSLAVAGFHVLLLAVAVGSGLLAAFASQASAPDYRLLARQVAVAAAVCVASALLFRRAVGGRLGGAVATASAVPVVAALELAARASG
jgi:hypothetical protein